MKIETKFSLGDVVVPISQGSETVGDPCPECDGKGRLALVKGGDVPCQNHRCYNGLVNRTRVYPWAIRHEDVSEVGKIEATRLMEYCIERSETRYMLAATGIGSGRLWYERDLFASVEDAQVECDLRNGAIASVPA